MRAIELTNVGRRVDKESVRALADDVIHVVGRDQVTRLRDVDGDGEVDAYECFNHDTMKQIIELFLNNNLFKGGAVNMVQVDDVDQSRHRIEDSEELEKRFTVEYRNMDEVEK